MLKQGLKNFFVSLKHFFTPLGTMFLSILVGLSALIPGTLTAIKTLINGIQDLTKNVSLDFKALWEILSSDIASLDWSNPGEALETIFSDSWINEVLTQALSSILGSDFNLFAEHIESLIGTFISTVIVLCLIQIFFFAIGLIAGFLLTKFFIRRNIAKRSLWKWILSSVVNAVLAVCMLITIVILYNVWKPSAIFSAIALIILSSIVSIMSAYFVYAFKKIKFSVILNIKNIGLYLLSNALILVFSAILTFIAILINTLMGIFAGLSIFEIALCVIGFNADSYVQKLTNDMECSDKSNF